MPELYSTNSVGLHFREGVEKIKKAAKKNKQKKKTKIGNLNGQEIYGRKKLAYVDIWGKTSKIL